jgi:hypothetical protein
MVLISIAVTPALGRLCAAPVGFATLERPDLVIRYEAPLERAAENLAAIFPPVAAELTALFGWSLPQRPTVILIQDERLFRRLAGHPLIAAYAVPAENLVVIDFAKLSGSPARLRSVFKHELVHLFLHAEPGAALLPKWLEEGVAQWASEGVGDLLEQPHPSLMEDAMLAGTLIPLDELRARFPTDRRGLLLAYEQSRRMVTYIVNTHGRAALMDILTDMRSGSDLEAAFYRVLAATPREIEARWIAGQNPVTVWLSYLAGHLDLFLFLLAALLTLAAFVRYRLKKRTYTDDE